MLFREIYTQEYISELRERTGNDPIMIERTLFAFGLLEAIKSVDMPFVFKGGTSLIGRIRNHIIRKMFNGEIAGAYASRVMYLAASILTGNDDIVNIEDGSKYIAQRVEISKPKWFTYLRIVDPISYGYLIEASRLLKDVEI